MKQLDQFCDPQMFREPTSIERNQLDDVRGAGDFDVRICLGNVDSVEVVVEACP